MEWSPSADSLRPRQVVANKMNKIAKRIKKLEDTILEPQGKVVQVIQGLGETKEEAIARAGLTQKNLDDARLIIWRKIVSPKLRLNNVTKKR